MKLLVIVTVICALGGALAYNYLGEMGEWISSFFVIPPAWLLIKTGAETS